MKRLHHIVTTHTINWIDGISAGPDSKFTDIDKNGSKYEGKNLKDNNVNLTPSCNTGAGRSFNEENLNTAMNLNRAYYFYDAEYINEEIIQFKIYWCPINILKKVYQNHGNGKGTINRANKYLIEPYFTDVVPTIWDIH